MKTRLLKICCFFVALGVLASCESEEEKRQKAEYAEASRRAEEAQQRYEDYLLKEREKKVFDDLRKPLRDMRKRERERDERMIEAGLMTREELEEKEHKRRVREIHEKLIDE